MHLTKKTLLVSSYLLLGVVLVDCTGKSRRAASASLQNSSYEEAQFMGETVNGFGTIITQETVSDTLGTPYYKVHVVTDQEKLDAKSVEFFISQVKILSKIKGAKEQDNFVVNYSYYQNQNNLQKNQAQLVQVIKYSRDGWVISDEKLR